MDKTPTRRIDSTLPAPTLAQRCASLSTFQLIGAAETLAGRADAGSVAALASVRAEMARREMAAVA